MKVSLASTGELSSEAEQRLWDAWRAKQDYSARSNLIGFYLPFARAMASRTYRMRIDESVSFDDYVQYARVGLLEAVDRFDPRRRVPFKVYAARRVRGAILNGIGNETERAALYRFHASRLRQERSASINQGYTPIRVNPLAGLVELTVNLAMAIVLDADDDEEFMTDDAGHSNPYASTELLQLRVRILAAVDALPERERWIVQQHYLENYEFQDLAAALQLTKGRVSQLHARAIDRLRKMLTEQLIDQHL